MKIAVGTTSKQKIGYLTDLLNQFEIEYEVTAHEVESEISEQPKTSAETKLGSRNRAKNAITNQQDADLAVGIEFGYYPDKNGIYKMICWSSLVDRNGRIVSCRSQGVTLPKFYQDLLNENKYLCDFIGKENIKPKNKVQEYMYRAIENRKSVIENSLISCLIEYFADEE